jgi:hypothetical protein
MKEAAEQRLGIANTKDFDRRVEVKRTRAWEICPA